LIARQPVFAKKAIGLLTLMLGIAQHSINAHCEAKLMVRNFFVLLSFSKKTKSARFSCSKASFLSCMFDNSSTGISGCRRSVRGSCRGSGSPKHDSSASGSQRNNARAEELSIFVLFDGFSGIC
jgi:hypothetical protein